MTCPHGIVLNPEKIIPVAFKMGCGSLCALHLDYMFFWTESSLFNTIASFKTRCFPPFNIRGYLLNIYIYIYIYIYKMIFIIVKYLLIFLDFPHYSLYPTSSAFFSITLLFKQKHTHTHTHTHKVHKKHYFGKCYLEPKNG